MMVKSVAATNSSGSIISAQTKGYLYDTAWNLNVRTNNSSGSTTTFNVNNKNELTSGPHPSYSYDDNGNLLVRGDYVYTYDDENQLIRASDETYRYERVEFVYDGLGRMRKRLDYTWNGINWQLASTLRCVSMTPLGEPVEPLVYCRIASESPLSEGGTVQASRSRKLGESVPRIVTPSRSSCRFSLCNCSATDSSENAIRVSASSTIERIRVDLRLRLGGYAGTAIASRA
jgi:YD repeat-containing protein